MRRSQALFAALCAALALLVGATAAWAHDFGPGVLTMEETAPGRWLVHWTEPVDTRGSAGRVDPVFPPACTWAQPQLVCPAPGPDQVAFTGLHGIGVQVVVTVRTLDGERAEHLVRPEAPRVALLGAPAPTGARWLLLGLEHILAGPDHLAFVAGLLLVVGLRRRLLWTVTAFTVAHSVSLALAALAVVRLPRGPVEATIALSVLLVAREALRDEPTWTRRFPWAVALLFGVVHGLGFAGALADIGLPRQSVAPALLLFNLGVELGQLAVIGAVALLVRVGGARLARPDLRRGAAYLIGVLAAWWFLDRTLAIAGVT
ncbi:MAG: HupE/UreJ family protein [Polyangiaceae bacterium]